MNNTSILPVEEDVSDDTETTMLLKPIAPVDCIIEAFREYSLLKSRLLGEHDYQTIRGKKYIKKSGFRKLSIAFGISTQVTRENRLDRGDYFVYEITVRAIASNGRYVEACSSCASNERDFSHLEHDTRSTAQTRASNRAIADLIGSGEISAEEITSEQCRSDVHYRGNASEETTSPTHHTESPGSDGEPITAKQRSLLVKLIERKYKDEQTRSGLFQRLPTLSKQEARDAIKKMLDTQRTT